jgi:diadenosine tetraphosphate (Ap4A) HIT family hydrolase
MKSKPTQRVKKIKDCPFCPMFKKTRKNIIDIEPLNPVVKGHRIVIPRRHVKDFSDDPMVTAQVMHYVAQLGKKVRYANIIASKGIPATQSVFHLHVHIIPLKIWRKKNPKRSIKSS